jgi:hypothetical protein
MTKETVIIVWDSAKKVQHFVRQASFDTKAKDFGFIVPTPSVPNFGVADTYAFERLEALIPTPASTAGMDTAAGMAAESKEVEVIKTERVGDYQATVLKAVDGAGMSRWLKKNGFISRAAMTEWLDHYSKKSWYFTALKYVADPAKTTRTGAIRISFKTDKPHYPYKMPKDAFKTGWVRPLKLYFVSDGPVESSYSESNEQWSAEKVWSGELPEDQRAAFAEEISLKTDDIPGNALVTIFENGREADTYDQDLVFAGTGSIGPFLWGGVVVMVIAAWAFTRRSRQKFGPAPTG